MLIWEGRKGQRWMIEDCRCKFSSKVLFPLQHSTTQASRVDATLQASLLMRLDSATTPCLTATFSSTIYCAYAISLTEDDLYLLTCNRFTTFTKFRYNGALSCIPDDNFSIEVSWCQNQIVRQRSVMVIVLFTPFHLNKNRNLIQAWKGANKRLDTSLPWQHNPYVYPTFESLDKWLDQWLRQGFDSQRPPNPAIP